MKPWLIAAGAYHGLRLGVFLLPLDGMLVHRRSIPRNLLRFPNNLPVPIYTPGWREALRVKCLAQEHNTVSSATWIAQSADGTLPVTMRPLRFLGKVSINTMNTAAKRTAHEYKFKLPVSYAFPVMY